MESWWWLRGVVPVPGGRTGIQSLDLLALLGILTLRLLPRWRQLVKYWSSSASTSSIDRTTGPRISILQHHSASESSSLGYSGDMVAPALRDLRIVAESTLERCHKVVTLS